MGLLIGPQNKTNRPHLTLKELDEDYARWALKNYAEMVPEMELIKGVKERLDEVRAKG